MGFIVKEHELDRLNSGIENDRLKDLWDGLFERVERNTRCPGLIQPGDTQEWWHLIWERVSDAAFVQAVKPSEKRGEWLRQVILQVCEKPLDEWIGPWFRPRKDPVEGQLETSHVGLAIATAVDLCPSLFSDEEMSKIKDALKNKCQVPCRNWLDKRLSENNHFNNWFMVLLNGYGTVSALLKDDDAIQKAVRYYRFATRLYNNDSYGESLQYWNYASIHLSHLYEILVRYKPELQPELDIACYARCIPWAVSSFMYMKPLEGWGSDEYPRSINFGDSAAMFRPTGDLLIHIAYRAKGVFPREAGLARWLFEKTYQNTRLEPTERATFGFFNTFQFLTLLMYPEAADPVSPEGAQLAKTACFESGSMIARDRWNNPKTILGVQGGYEPQNATSHRHQDQNSFILAHLNERFFIDPGHCCYRLATQAFSISTKAHNTWIFKMGSTDDKVLEQKMVTGNVAKPVEPMNRRLFAEQVDEISAFASDAADVYGDPIKKAVRIWIAAMPNTLFIVDRIESSQPIRVQANFSINNRDNRLRYNIASDTKLVFRRNKAAMKFFLVRSNAGEDYNPTNLSYSWGYMHDCYHPLPNQKGQGAEGSSVIFTYQTKEPKTSNLMVYAVAMDAIENITKWHILNLEDDVIYVEPPSKTGGFSMQLCGDLIKIKNHYNGKVYTISYNGINK